MRTWGVLLFLWMYHVVVVAGSRYLTATSLVTCIDNSQISPSYFNVSFNPNDNSLHYDIDLNTEIDGKVDANIQVYAYGFSIVNEDIDLCSLGWVQFCPLHPGSMQVHGIAYLSGEYTSQIPGIAYNVPDIDAIVKVIITKKGSDEVLSCLQASFSNGKTVAQTGAKWATAVVAGLGLLFAAIFSMFGNSNAASHISANSVSLFLYFQSVVIIAMQSVERVPPIASAWAENLAWSMGLIRVQFMQDIFRWYIQSTGGTPTLYFKGTTKQILVQRAYNYLQGLHEFARRANLPELGKRSLDYSLSSNANLLVLRGIKRIGYNSHIEPTSIVVTGFTFFVIFGYLLFGILVIMKQLLKLLIKYKKINPNTMNNFRTSFQDILKGSVLRYIYIGFTQLIILSLWEFTQVDSPAIVLLSALALVLVLGVIGFSLWKVIKFGKLSVEKFNNPAALLYGDSKILNRYGFCYTMFKADKYWFGIVLVGYSLIKGIFIGLCQSSGKTSTLVIFILDLAFTIYLIILKPFLNKPTNITNYIISIVNTINSFLFVFFSDLFNQADPVSSIMGWVFFILNAAFSFCLLVMIIVFIVLALISKNRDARFAPAKDDRTSFQRQSSMRYKNFDAGNKEKADNELFTLGVAAQDHSTNWESDMYKIHEMSGSDQIKNHLSPTIEQEKISSSSNESSTEKRTLGGKIKNKLARGLSLRSNKEKKTNNNVTPSTNNTFFDDDSDEKYNTLNLLSKFPDRSTSHIPINSHLRLESIVSDGDSSIYSNRSVTNPKDNI